MNRRFRTEQKKKNLNLIPLEKSCLPCVDGGLIFRLGFVFFFFFFISRCFYFIFFSLPPRRRHGSLTDVLRHAAPVGVQLRRLQPQPPAHAPAHGRGTAGVGDDRDRGDNTAAAAARRLLWRLRGETAGRGRDDRHGRRPGRPGGAPGAQEAETRDGPESGHRHRERGRGPVVESGRAEAATGEDLETVRRHRRIVIGANTSCKYIIHMYDMTETRLKTVDLLDYFISCF